jgi:hypothetical protein
VDRDAAARDAYADDLRRCRAHDAEHADIGVDDDRVARAQPDLAAATHGQAAPALVQPEDQVVCRAARTEVADLTDAGEGAGEHRRTRQPHLQDVHVRGTTRQGPDG